MADQRHSSRQRAKYQKMLVLLAAALAFFSSSAHGYGGRGRGQLSRRSFFHTVPVVVAGGGASAASAEVISASRCDSGEGEGCATMDKDDPAAELIMRLRAKSKENAARRVDEELRRCK